MFISATIAYIYESYDIIQNLTKKPSNKLIFITGFLVIYTGFIFRFFDYYKHERKMPMLIRAFVEWGSFITYIFFFALIIFGILLLGFKGILFIKASLS